jgi:(1->4)-alpha-D-glucan 1-alpha-D-glucosylmutase
VGANEGLAYLARLHGIALEYHDIWGKLHRAQDASLAALLAEMGVSAHTPEEIEAAIAAHESTRWRSILPPVILVREGTTTYSVRLALPAALDERTLEWRLVEESGAARSSSFEPRVLASPERTEVGGERYVARELELDIGFAPGYHRLEILRDAAVIATASLIVTPHACFRPDAVNGEGRVWGPTAQLYGVRSDRNWGIGDFTDLLHFLEQWALRGGGIIGVNPLHALFPHNPAHASPYSPSSRLFVNVLYLDVEAIEDFAESREASELVHSPVFQARLHKLREGELVDYVGVATTKVRVLEIVYAHFRAHHLGPGTSRARAFRAFQGREGEQLRRHALFEALQERFHREDPSIWGWQVWPEHYRDPNSPDVARYAREHVERVELFEYLQWQADLQLARIGTRSFELGLGIGLYQDLAVSIDRAGAESWANQNVYAVSASVGAPPDDFNLGGQNWGLPPMQPEQLRRIAYEPFIATLRANMRHAGALRIDHVMTLMRLFWIPPNGTPAEGAYVEYPFADLLGILALESHRNRCMVIGEDLGTVPDEMRSALKAAGVLSYRLLYFERDAAGEFKPPNDYPADALVAASTHDLPPLAGYWEGRDLARRHELGHFPSDEARQQQLASRAQDRERFRRALEREGLLPGDRAAPARMTPELARALHVYLARTPARVLVVQLEDVLGVQEQVNLPGTTMEHPNWCRKLPVALERIPHDEQFLALTENLARVRGTSSRARMRTPRAEANIPRATYRLQLHRDFNFAQVTALIPYLDALGVSHIYCSPYLRARPGSQHGYDIVDHSSFNPEIGSKDDFERFVATLEAHGMGHILDMVPNHMGVMGADNAWWMDVLENGPTSAYADYFDIDWDPIDPDLAGHVLVPVLGNHYAHVLERGELRLVYESDGGSFAVWYFEHRFPIDPREYPRILQRAVRELAPDALPAGIQAELESLIAAFGHLPERQAAGPQAVAERGRDKELHKARLARLAREHTPLAQALERAAREASVEELHDLLEAQAYRVAYWRVAADEINYRRFFDVNDLAALRMENEAVFEATHRFVLELAAAGKVDGLRIDHPDGLFDPAQYFRRLQVRYAELASLEGCERPLYVVAEKIVAPHEHLAQSWPVYGTTGYRFANVVTGLFVDTAAEARVDRAWRAFVREEAIDFAEAAYRGKHTIMDSALAGELTVLATRLLRIARADRRTRDHTLNSLRQALAEIVACFPVYRTYVTGGASGITRQDRRFIDWAVAQAKRRSRVGDPSTFDFVKSVLTVRPASSELEPAYRAFAMRFQQFTSPVTAKGVEDTSFYVFNRLASLNDVGGDPDAFGMAVSAFHGASADRAARWPHTMLATSTHDNKRSEDVRARINVISELPAAWRLAVRRWSRLTRSKKRVVEGDRAPSRNDEYLFYQTLVGSFPAGELGPHELAAYCTRIEGFMRKAIREAKVRTSWVNPNEAYETAVAEFVRAALGRLDANPFLDDFRGQLAAFVWFGMLNSVSMALIKFSSPGVPDLYQGNEILDFSLVDPDNRRPVDYERRRGLLDQIKALAAAGPAADRLRTLFETPQDGRAKLWVIWRALEVRRKHPDLFKRGDYHPLAVSGARANHAVAYARRMGNLGIVVIAGRLFASLGLELGVVPCGETAWQDTAVDLSFLPAGTRLENLLTGESLAAKGTLPLGRAMANFPGALLGYGL